MADQHNDNIPALTNSIAEDVVDIKENLEFHKDCFQAITTGWANDSTAALRILPQNTVVLFGNKDAPTGWTKVTTWEDGAMIVVSSDADGTSLGSGGAAKAQSAHTHAAGSYVIPNHVHNLAKGSASTIHNPTGSVSVTASGGRMYTDAGEGSTTIYSLDSGTDTDGGSGSVTGTSGDTSDLPYYQEVIACTKD